MDDKMHVLSSSEEMVNMLAAELQHGGLCQHDIAALFSVYAAKLFRKIGLSAAARENVVKLITELILKDSHS